jgi:hypothetical protein
MNTFKKIFVDVAVAVSVGMLALGYAVAPANAEGSSGLALPEMASLTAQVSNRIGEQVATELKATFAQLVSAPRPARSVRPESVIITESNAVLVVATRLPPLDAVADASVVKLTLSAAL